MFADRLLKLVAAILFVMVWLFSAAISHAANISVDEDCSLSEAIHAANNDHEFDRCTAGDGEDTITLTGDITLSGRLPTITTDLAIDGSNYTVSGADSTAIFSIDDAQVTLQNITIANGRTGTRGGAIYVDAGTLNLKNAIVKDSWAGDAGGGIYASNSTVSIHGSQINDNTAGRGGGGLYFSSESSVHTLNIEELSSFSGNIASQDGGAIRVAGGIVAFDKSSFSNNQADEGGVIEIWNGNLKVENTTISGNHAREGGGINAGADSDFISEVTLIHVTMANNTAEERGASIALTGSQATLSIGNSIISGDTAEGVTHCHPGVSEYSVIAWVRNAISDGSCPLVAQEGEETTTETTNSQSAEGAGVIATPEARDEPPPEPMAPLEPRAEEEPRDCVYVVQAGDSLISIAEQLNITVDDLWLLNRLTDDFLSVGQALDLPGCAPDEIDPDSPDFPYICDDVPIDIVIKSGHRDLRCEVVEVSDIDNHPLMNAGITVAVEIWGRTEAGVEVCFADDGSLVFIDTSASPPAISRLSLYASGDLMCGKFTKSGVVAQVSALSDESSIPLSECTVTTSNVLRLRDEADWQQVKALVPFRVTLPAKARTASWFFVEFMGMDGWVSAGYVQTEGICE